MKGGYIVYYTNELRHHGIKGQRWGIRRFQNEDGSLTSSGRARYNEDGTRKDPKKMTDEELSTANKRLQAEQQYNQLTGRSQPDKALISDTAIKLGASIVATAGATMLANQLGGSPVAGKELATKVLLNSGLVSMSVIAGTFGGQVRQ